VLTVDLPSLSDPGIPVAAIPVRNPRRDSIA